MNNQKTVRLDNETATRLTTQRGYDFFDVVIDDYLKLSRKKLGEFLFTGPKSGYSMTARQYGRLVSDWFTGVGLNPHLYGTHS
jgi:hypothetical protein